MKRYVLFAGVNGAGKSTLYSLISSINDLEKINLDDKVRTLGDWKDVKVVSKAARMIIHQIDHYFDNGVSFTQETTLCGKTILRNIARAKKLGYSIEMHYVGLDSAEIAKQRVRNRVEHGGHGIAEDDIERRYEETLKNMKLVIPQCDLVAVYDNTEAFKRFAIFKGGKCVRISHRVPEWYQCIMKEYNFYGWQTADVPAVAEEYKKIDNPRHLYDLLSEIWCADTCAPRMRDDWTEDNKTLGQCSITAFLAQDIFGGEVYGILRSGGNYHCYNVIGDCLFDLTSEQFLPDVLSYEGNPIQSRDVHFAKEEKRLRYEYLKAELKKKLEELCCV